MGQNNGLMVGNIKNNMKMTRSMEKELFIELMEENMQMDIFTCKMELQKWGNGLMAKK